MPTFVRRARAGHGRQILCAIYCWPQPSSRSRPSTPAWRRPERARQRPLAGPGSGQHGGASPAAASMPAPGPAKPTGSFEASCRNIQVQGAQCDRRVPQYSQQVPCQHHHLHRVPGRPVQQQRRARPAPAQRLACRPDRMTVRRRAKATTTPRSPARCWEPWRPAAIQARLLPRSRASAIRLSGISIMAIQPTIRVTDLKAGALDIVPANGCGYAIGPIGWTAVSIGRSTRAP